MKKIIAVDIEQAEGVGFVIYHEGDEVPVKAGIFKVNDSVKIKNSNILSNTTMGTLQGFSFSSAKNLLAHVNWLKDAPPIKTLLSNIVMDRPQKFWMVVGDMESTGHPSTDHYTTGGLAAVRQGTHAPRARYWSEADAIAQATALTSSYGIRHLVMEATIGCNAENHFAL
ncbi:hypothetical protein GAP52_069 [Cronobacter phage vB_CsaP_GAP52]|uniref:Uncharacterized protein n=1 Tax=Cronobacter phage vB_CsaP_GAP52 TaxID=1141137 RepID=K4F7G5_9CAUD|nr:hypothetical protein D858_gp045 [Cronobacter phage vB_CsaP_GAP52]AFC22063.1 hypothetical protein GAP52_069 [Cronobacter phage vB_CsaP_GAP52]